MQEATNRKSCVLPTEPQHKGSRLCLNSTFLKKEFVCRDVLAVWKCGTILETAGPVQAGQGSENNISKIYLNYLKELHHAFVLFLYHIIYVPKRFFQKV